MWRSLTLGCLTLLISACASQRLIVMHNPKTGEMAQCQSNTMNSFIDIAAVDNCAKSYEMVGWERMVPK